MADLRNILQEFSAAIRSGSNFSPGALSGVPCPSDRGVEVYRNNYRGNLHDTLALVYPVIRRLVGEEFFRYLARHLIAESPAKSGNLHHYGSEMPGFLSGFDAVRQIPYLPDMASLEWACHRAYYAPDSPFLDLQRLNLLTPDCYERMVLQPSASCTLFRSSYPVHAIWKIHQDGQEERLAQLDLEAGGDHLLIFRPHLEVEVKVLHPELFAWVDALASGRSLGDVCDEIGAKDPAVTLEEALRYAVTEGVFHDFKVLQDN